MLHLNVGSLNQNFESLKKLKTTIKLDYRAICFTEIWSTNDPRNKTWFNLENYISINQVSKQDRGGGTCVFIHNSLTFKLRSDLRTNSNDIESLAIEIINKIYSKSTGNYVINQPTGDFKQYETYLENFFNKIKNSNKTIYTVEDTNLN